MSAQVKALSDGLSSFASSASNYVSNEDNKTVVAIAGVTTVAGLTWYLTSKVRKSGYEYTGSLELGSGAVDRKAVEKEVKNYYDSYNTLERGEGAVITRKDKVAELVDKFYSLVTDLYEWGWGQSFHFSPPLPCRDWSACETAHESRMATMIGLEPGKTALDVGCGVGGPMRTIAAVSGGKVVGITINEYQVQRAGYHNEKQGLAAQCSAVRGNFLEMPFEAASFDAAYAIEATCHAPKLEDVYGEVFRVLKPGSRFVTYEWVSTPAFDVKNKRHVAIMDEIIIGNGLPDMRTWKQAEEAGKNVGFKLVKSRDLAIRPDGSVNLWFSRLGTNVKLFKLWVKINCAIVAVVEALRIAPKGLGQVHQMLVDTAIAIIEGGQEGIFTPMHMLVFEKPL